MIFVQNYDMKVCLYNACIIFKKNLILRINNLNPNHHFLMVTDRKCLQKLMFKISKFNLLKSFLCKFRQHFASRKYIADIEIQLSLKLRILNAIYHILT